MQNPPGTLAIILFELGHLQVFYYQTPEDWAKRISPSAYHWYRLTDGVQYGPFPTAYVAVKDYSQFILKEAEEKKNPAKNNILTFDKSKRKKK
jgi:hypothetical protein